MQQIPALLKVRQTKSKKVSERTGGELKNRQTRQRKICWLVMSKKDQDRLYTIVDHDNVDK